MGISILARDTHIGPGRYGNDLVVIQ